MQTTAQSQNNDRFNSPSLKKDEKHTSSAAHYVNPNLVKSLQFSTPSITAGERFSTTNFGFTSGVKDHNKDQYMKKLQAEKAHRQKMKDIMLGQSFELGFDGKGSCPTNEEMLQEGQPMFH